MCVCVCVCVCMDGWMDGWMDRSILGGGGSQNWTSFWGHFYAIFGPFLSSIYRKKEPDGDSLGVAKISILFIYLFLN